MLKLNISNCESITHIAICEVAKNCKKLILFDISYCQINDETLKIISNNCKKLVDLGISGCDFITDNGIIEIAEKCHNLTTLFAFDDNNITDDGIIKFAKTCKIIEMFYISSNKITNNGIINFAKNCPKNIDINFAHCTQITYKGICELAKICIPKSLNVDRCYNITNDECERFFEDNPHIDFDW